MYLPPDDRRHYVAWSERVKEDFGPDYWNKLFRWYDNGGDRHVAAYLAQFMRANIAHATCGYSRAIHTRNAVTPRGVLRSCSALSRHPIRVALLMP